MEPNNSNDHSKKLRELLNSLKTVNYSFSTVPVSFNYIQKQETADEMIARLDNDDAVIEAMTSYPTAERMLNDLFKKES